ncbi:MAG: pyruvate, water dikinase regulatory protein [Succiniclasticum sp.]|nr:pyruvate, water dikinase regulatory protein [Succiniclasticum sp.]
MSPGCWWISQKAREGTIIGNSKNPVIYALSDSIGGTAESVIKATVSQFTETQFDVIRIPYVNNKQQIDRTLEEAKENHAVVCYTIVSAELRKHLADRALALNLQVVDVLGPMLRAIEKNSGLMPKNQAGLIHALDHEYFKRVEAIEFAVKYDDGKNPLGLLKADIVIIGVSRTSKTPLSMYLANKQLKVANVPLVPEIAPPPELFKVPPHRIIGLLIDPYKLIDIRTTRLKTMGLSDKAVYADINRINEELEYAKAIMRRVHCMVINVSNRAIEETAGIVLDYYHKNQERYHGEA